ncbi:MAG TPA: cupredoxin domain-containing protein [Acidimicrobiales bacterium]|nr:cupredoxin domain-containing protein [Acidimicrobiales bacterium]
MRKVLGLLIAAAMAASLAACGDDDDDPTVGGGDPVETTTAGADGGGGTATVTAAGFAFSPTEVAVAAGEVTLELVNDDGVTHTLTVDDAGIDIEVAGGASGTGSGTFESGQDYEFRCRIHPSMTGTVTAS